MVEKKNEDVHEVDFNYWIKSDCISSGFPEAGLKGRMFNPIMRFQYKLRLVEYLSSRPGLLPKMLFLWNWIFLERLRQRLGFTIPLHVFGPGLSIAHYGTIVVNGNASIGANCRIHPGVCIGGVSGNAPKIGSNVYIGPGAKIIGDIIIGDNVAIGANAVVNKDVPSDTTVAGVPAAIVSNKGSRAMIIPGSELALSEHIDWSKYATSEVLADENF